MNKQAAGDIWALSVPSGNQYLIEIKHLFLEFKYHKAMS